MSELISAPLAGASFDGLCTIRALPAPGQILIRYEDSADFREKLRDVLGLCVPEPLRSDINGGEALLWMAPDELLFLCPHDMVGDRLARLNAVFEVWFITITDVSDARAFFDIEGPQLRDVLAKLTPADMAPDAFTPGTVRRSKLAQVAAGYWLRSETAAQVFCYRSVADYAFKVLSLAAAPGGEVGFHSP